MTASEQVIDVKNSDDIVAARFIDQVNKRIVLTAIEPKSAAVFAVVQNDVCLT